MDKLISLSIAYTHGVTNCYWTKMSYIKIIDAHTHSTVSCTSTACKYLMIITRPFPSYWLNTEMREGRGDHESCVHDEGFVAI